MPEFAYKVRTSAGAIVESTIEAIDQRVAIDRLREQRYILLEINELKKSTGTSFLKRLSPFKPKVPAKELVLFSRQLSTLVSAGVPLVQGLSILIEQITTPLFKQVVQKISQDIEAGISIAEAMGKHPQVFPELYVSMIHAGEIGGILDVILERLSGYLESSEKLKNQVKGSLSYPIIISVISFGVVIFLLTVVLPTFKTIFEGFSAELPAPTRLLLALSDFVKANVLVVLSIPVGIVIAIQRWYKTPTGRKVIDARLLKLPIFGILLKKVAVAKFTRTLGTLVKSGVPILQAMETVAKTSGNVIIEREINKAREAIREGERIVEPLKRSGIFPNMVVQMIGVGEETGNLDTMLNKIADFYDEEVEVALHAMTSMIEPLIMVVMGIVLGGLVVAMLLPMFQLGDLASRQG